MTRLGVLAAAGGSRRCSHRHIGARQGSERSDDHGPWARRRDHPRRRGSARRRAAHATRRGGRLLPRSVHHDPESHAYRTPGGRASGPRYAIAYQLPGPDGQLAELRQDLYPYAKPDPVTYVKSGEPYLGHGGDRRRLVHRELDAEGSSSWRSASATAAHRRRCVGRSLASARCRSPDRRGPCRCRATLPPQDARPGRRRPEASATAGARRTTSAAGRVGRFVQRMVSRAGARPTRTGSARPSHPRATRTAQAPASTRARRPPRRAQPRALPRHVARTPAPQ